MISIRRERMTYGQSVTEDTLTPQYEKALQTFGKMCIHALIEEKFYFSRSEILKLTPQSLKDSHENVIMGFLIKCNIPMLNVGDYYQPLHKTFLEFVTAHYLKSLINRQNQHSSLLQDVLASLQNINMGSVEQILLFTVEMLQDNAYVIFEELENIGLKYWLFGNLR